MPNPLMQAWANALVGYSTVVEPGQTVAITGGIAAEPLLRAIYREVISRGAHPVMLAGFPDLRTDLFAYGSDDQIRFITPIEQFVRTGADRLVQVIADTNTRAMAGVDPARHALFQKARTDLIKTFSEREDAGKVDWTLTLYPTDALAQEAEMSTADYADFVFQACKLHAPDPIAAWKAASAEQQRLIDWLAGKRLVKITGPGTELELDVSGRTWINADGHHNFPDGEIFTAPLENSASGHFTYSFPAIYGGRAVAGIRLEFEQGRVVKATAEKGEEVLLAQIDIDDGARLIGEFAIGTNFDIQRFTSELLFDEKIGGTCHIALGETYMRTGGTNSSAIHWDMICDLRDGGRIVVDGRPFLVDGQFVV